jgi:hypothetical protein
MGEFPQLRGRERVKASERVVMRAIADVLDLE